MSSYQVGSNCDIAHTAIIGEGCKIGSNVKIHHFAVIYDGTEIGDDCEIFDHAVIGRPPKAAGILISKIEENLPPVTIGNKTVIGASAVIYADCHIGNNVLICDLASLREGCSVGDNTVIARLVTCNHHVTIGKNVKIIDVTHITSNTVIEDDVFIGVAVSSANDNGMRISGDQPTNNKIVLRKGCKIGASAVILPSVEIGENSIVGANSVVTKNVRENALVLGTPAREREK
ncbi:MAG: N-acetyltransferase [Firmicutes bacterium]|nr:N-acetyltransferase [Bacillota bacterium]